MDGFFIEVQAIVKAREDKDGRRLVEVEASNEFEDSEGDVILQRALLDSADSFVKSGHLDIDHYSELGHRIGIKNPSAYIVGRPVEVKDLGGGRTGVVGEIRRSRDNLSNPIANKYDELWESLISEPPVEWRASIYGFPKADMVEDCREMTCTSRASRYLVKGLDWRSLAFTRNPINTSITGFARVVTMKAAVEHFVKGVVPEMALSMPSVLGATFRSVDELAGHYHRHIKDRSPYTGGFDSVQGFQQHFMGHLMILEAEAEILAHALMYHLLLEKKRLARKNS